MNFNTEYILSIPLLKDQNSRRDYNKSVSEGMRQFFAVETLSDSEKLHCSQCKEKTSVSKQTELWSLPQVLIIHIKRFYFSERSMDYRKIDAPVEFDTQLDL